MSVTPCSVDSHLTHRVGDYSVK